MDVTACSSSYIIYTICIIFSCCSHERLESEETAYTEISCCWLSTNYPAARRRRKNKQRCKWLVEITMLPNEKSLPIIPIDVWNIKFEIQQKNLKKTKKKNKQMGTYAAMCVKWRWSFSNRNNRRLIGFRHGNTV
jgi:hypothetical protein